MPADRHRKGAPPPDLAVPASREPAEAGPVFCVAALPFDVRPGEVARNLARALEGVEEAAAAGAELLVLPEKWTTSFLPSYEPAILRASEDALESLHARAVELEVTVIGSAPAGERRPFNEVHVLGAAGSFRPYRKRVLFSPTGEGRQCAPGSAPPAVFETPVGRVCAVVCYDLRFPEVTRHAFYESADLLVVPAQWPHPRTGVLELLTRARAAENQCWVLSCNRAGVASLGELTMEFPGSALLADPLGVLAARSDDGNLLVAEVDYGEMAEVRRRVPCRRDLQKAGLEPRTPEFAP